MDLGIRPVREKDIDDVVALSLLAWAPVFQSFKSLLGPGIFAIVYPDWKKSQREEIEKVCRDGARFNVWVAEVDDKVVGFVTAELHEESKRGEVYFLAVHPAYQNRGIGTELNLYALDKMRERGMQLAVVGTGGDPAHAPARRSYEKAGYTALPLVRYYQELT